MPTSIASMFVGVTADISQAQRNLGELDSVMSRAARSIAGAGTTLTAAITVPIAGATAAIVGTGASFEGAFSRVRKTVDLSVDDMAKLRSGIIDLSTSVEGGGKSAEDLAAIAAVAGQLGIEGGDNLLRFTGLAARLSGATGIAADQVGEDLARIAILTKTPAEAWENMASTIVGLGNQMAGSEAEIIELANRLSGALSSVGVAAPDILGIASALGALGVNPEAGGTAISKFFLDMIASASGAAGATAQQTEQMQNLRDRITDLGESLQTAQARQAAFGRNTPAAQVQATAAQIEKYNRELEQTKAKLAALQSKTGTGNLEGLARVAGVTTDEFKALVKSDPAKAFQSIVAGLARIRDSAGPEGVVGALADLGVDEARMRDALLRLAGGEDTLAKALQVANDEWNANKALANENAKAMEDVNKQFALLTNQLKGELIAAWDELRPTVLEVMGIFKTTVIPAIRDAVTWFKELGPEGQRSALGIAAIGAAIGPALIALAGLAVAFEILLGPVGWIALAATAGAALALAWKNDFNGMRTATENFVGAGIAAFEGFRAGVRSIFLGIVDQVANAFTAIGNALPGDAGLVFLQGAQGLKQFKSEAEAAYAAQDKMLALSRLTQEQRDLIAQSEAGISHPEAALMTPLPPQINPLSAEALSAAGVMFPEFPDLYAPGGAFADRLPAGVTVSVNGPVVQFTGNVQVRSDEDLTNVAMLAAGFVQDALIQAERAADPPAPPFLPGRPS